MLCKHVYVTADYHINFLKSWQNTQSEDIRSLRFVKPEGCVSHLKSVDLSGTKMLNVNEIKRSISPFEMHPILRYNT